jgi:hypothetical protein
MIIDERKHNKLILLRKKYLLIYFMLFFNIINLISCTSQIDFTIKKTVPSPDNEFIAVVFLHNGNSLTSYRPQVAIIGKNEKFRYKNKDTKVFVGYRTKYIDAFWKNDSTLVIKHNCLDEYIFKQIKIYNGIKIEYILATRETVNPEDVNDFETGDYFRRKYYPENK